MIKRMAGQFGRIAAQQRCAKQGHAFPNGKDGVCSRCGLAITPPGRGGGERAVA